MVRVPFTPAAAEVLVQHFELLDLRDVEHSPALLKRSRPHLVHQQADDTMLDAVIVRLGDAPHVQIGELDQPLLGNRVAQLVID